jgi:hypothetical protein
MDTKEVMWKVYTMCSVLEQMQSSSKQIASNDGLNTKAKYRWILN